MNELFHLEPVYPKGFHYYPDFINEKEEHQLIAEILKIELQSFQFQGYEAKRKVASFGYDYSFENGSLKKGKEIPTCFTDIILRVGEKLKKAEQDFAELLVTEYPVGSVINWHRDAPPFDLIAGISLSSDCLFKLRPHDPKKRTRKSTFSIPIHRRSLYVISKESRTEWQHSIAPVKNTRYSVTLRTLK